jgi:hypothetical protein
LRENTQYHFSVVAVDADGKKSRAASGTFVTGALPPALVAPVTRIELVRGPGTTYPTLFDFNHQDPPLPGQQARFNGHVVLDSKARIIWYHENTLRPRPDHPRGAFEIDRLPNGNFVYDFVGRSWDGRIVEMTPFGDIVRMSPSVCTSGTTLPIFAGSHHEITPLADGKVLYLGRRVDRFEGLDMPQEESTIREWDPATNADREVWRPSSFLDPATHRGLDSSLPILLGCDRQVQAAEWTHANTLILGLSGNYLWNSRHLDQLISLGAEPDPRNPAVARCNSSAVGRPDLACAQWLLGGPNSDFTFPDPTDQFFGAHSPFELLNPDPNKTNILIYDNGLHRPTGQYTRALELELDFTTMTARKVWEYRHDPDIFTAAVGRVVRLDNGNTLVNCGFGTNPRAVDPNVTHRIVEVAPDGQVVAEIELESFGKAVQYRAHPIPSIAGERVIPAPKNACPRRCPPVKPKPGLGAASTSPVPAGHAGTPRGGQGRLDSLRGR